MSGEFVSQEYEVAQAGADVREGTFGSRLLKLASSTALIVTIILSISLVAFTVTFFLSKVNGPSMMQTVNADFTWDKKVYDNVLVNRYATPKRGDIIVVEYRNPETNKVEDYYIKRLIATEGDKIRLNRYNTGIDHYYKTAICYAGSDTWVEIDEWYLDDHWGVIKYYGDDFNKNLREAATSVNHSFYNFKQYIETPEGESPNITIPNGYIFYMGDNRGSANYTDYSYHSKDCTSFGPQPTKYIEGVVADIIKEKESIPNYVFRKVTDFILLKWIFG